MTTNTRRFPAEWEKQQGMLLCFPHNGKDWPGKYEAVQWAFVEFIKKVATFEKVFLVVANENQKNKVNIMLKTAHVALTNVSYIIHKTNRSLIPPYTFAVQFNVPKVEDSDFSHFIKN